MLEFFYRRRPSTDNSPHGRLSGDALVRALFADITLQLSNMEKRIMSTLDDALADIQAESTAIDSVSSLITSLKQQVADALSGTTISPTVQAKIDSVFSGLEANKAKLATALATGPTGQPVTPAPTPAP